MTKTDNYEKLGAKERKGRGSRPFTRPMNAPLDTYIGQAVLWLLFIIFTNYRATIKFDRDEFP